ncbi:MAG: hypothetical protein H0T42_10355 [Deltaproteobacteria bacterium]|nr:hypothetical protein [Deltaproteobacteria bacterium]
MNRAQLEHVIRASAAISGDDEIIVVGSQAILGQFPAAPPELCRSNEADVYPKNKPELADMIDGSIGELSPFHQTFGYYGQGVGPDTAIVPKGWESRLIAVTNANTRGATGWCLEVHDLVLSKYAAGREKDFEFVGAVIRHGLVHRDELLRRLSDLPIDEAHRARLHARISLDTRGLIGG